jgi:hypothetical protein
MFVYGVRCAPADLVDLPADAEADYYMDFGLLVFPTYTRATCIHSHGRLSPAFWDRVKSFVEDPTRPRSVDLEHPWITGGEDAVIRALQEYYPGLDAGWYHVPQAVLHAPEIPELRVYDE